MTVYLKDFRWNVREPLPKKLPDEKLKFKGSKLLVILRTDKPVITKKIQTTSSAQILKIYEKEINKKIKADRSKSCKFVENIYYAIGRFLHKNDRKCLVDKFEKGTLKVKELFGDHIYFEGFVIEKDVIFVGFGS